MGLLRSEAMKYGMLVLPVQDARRYIDKIGKDTNIQFEDMNAREMRRPYRKHIQRIDEMERILRFMFDEIGRIEDTHIQQNKVEEFLAADGTYKLDVVEAELAQLYQQFMKFKENNAVLVSDRNAAVEESEVISVALKILGSGSGAGGNDLTRPILGEDALAERRLGYVAGVVPKSDEMRFARALWRASRGNTFTQFSPIQDRVVDPKTGSVVEKSVFVVYFQGAVGSMKDRIIKVCSAFGVNQYAWPASPEAARQRDTVLRQQLKEKERALSAYSDLMRTEARDLVTPSNGNPTGNSKIEDWRLFCIKEKSIYTILNQCEEGMALRVNVWYPASEESKIQMLLKEACKGDVQGQGAFLNPDRGTPRSTPPTYIRTNEYTEPWQEVIDTYGIPRYQEANPALLTVVTFPFIFGMMYGDVGHGSMLLLAGLWLVMKGDTLKFSVPQAYAARYLVFSLGIFATFAGFMYNDFFSIGLPLMDSRFEDDGSGTWKPTFDTQNTGGPGPYPFGLDWAWKGASNELLFVNSLKMKLSVLFGVVQMTVGLILRWSNAIYDKNITDFIFECIPMMVFMICFFGWMDWMILYKWVNPIDNPPSIINSLICMAMGQQDNNPLWPGSVQLAKQLMVYTVVAVPFMLFPKPFILLFQHKQAEKNSSGHVLLADEEQAASAGHGGGHGHGEEFEFGEVFIHQIIETIEYVLGTVSHTASYLRIWALSLAHQQLSVVFFEKTFNMGLEMSFPANGIMLYFMFAAWFGVTLGVLLGMDVLECFLHTLRLHWVEFQSKFYKAGGEKFAPFSIRKLIDSSGAE